MEIVGLGQFVSDLLAMYLMALEEELLAACLTALCSGSHSCSLEMPLAP